ncbi:hypothetical protein EauS123_00024 [Exiguobacterium phage vB_EauS-123]|nr:hypothetical protein EauS123_00024 [Exiguobacterium phage vB_EauS-123]
MTDEGLFLTALATVFTGALTLGIFGWEVGNGFEKTKQVTKLLKGAFVKNQHYQVVEVKWNNDRLIVEEDGALVPVDCDAKYLSKIYDLIHLNEDGKKVYIKAKIDHKRLCVISVSGYYCKC